jgi:hypothetical protein
MAPAIAEQDGVLVFSETDDPLPGGARCLCMCVFDFKVAAEGVVRGTTAVKVIRLVSGGPGGSGVVFEGTLELSAGAGFTTIDSSPSTWCEPRATSSLL